MRITSIKAYQVDLPLKEGRYSWSNGNFVETFDATVVEVATDAGVIGYGCGKFAQADSAYALAIGLETDLAVRGFLQRQRQAHRQ